MSRSMILGGAIALLSSPAAAQIADHGGADPAAEFWQIAGASFTAGERRSPMVFDRNDVARCSGRWEVQMEALKEHSFPTEAETAFTDHLRLPLAAQAVDFYTMDEPDPLVARNAGARATRLLERVLNGDAAAARRYFEDLGWCSTHPETVRDDPEEAIDAPARGTTEPRRPDTPATLQEPAESDFDEPVNQARLAFIDMLVWRVHAGQAIADMLKPQVAFTYVARSACSDLAVSEVGPIAAEDFDTGFTFRTSYSSTDPECAIPPGVDVMNGFDLAETLIRWDTIRIVPEDHNMDVFHLSTDGIPEFLTIHIEPKGQGYAVSAIEYQVDLHEE